MRLLPAMKTARFKSVVAKAGRPTAHLQLVPAANDQVLQNAIDTRRVMSVNQTLTGQRKDHGIVGYVPEVASQILVFPKSLKAFSEHKIVGIDYSLLEEPKVVESKDPAPGRDHKTANVKIEEHPSPRAELRVTSNTARERENTASRKQPKEIREKPRSLRKAEPVRPISVKLPELRKKLQAVLREWEKGHEVKASKMLATVIEALP